MISTMPAFRFPLILIIIAFLACSTQPRQFEDQHYEKNVLFAQWKLDNGQKLPNSLIELWQNSESAKSEILKTNQLNKGILNTFQPVLVHQHYSPLAQMSTAQGNSVIQGWDFPQWGPWWIDILMTEVAAALIAHQNSIKNYQPGFCLESYLTAMKSWEVKNGIAIRSSLLIPNASALSQATKVFDESFKRLLSNAIEIDDPAIRSQVELAQKSGNLAAGSIRLLKLEQDQYLQIQNNTNIYSYKIDNHSLENTKWPDLLNTPTLNCSGAKIAHNYFYQKILSDYPMYCFENSFSAITLSRLDNRVWAPRSAHFLNEHHLAAQVNYMCSDLARFHSQMRMPDETQALVASLKFNPLLQAQILNESQKLLDLVRNAYRMLLEKK